MVIEKRPIPNYPHFLAGWDGLVYKGWTPTQTELAMMAVPEDGKPAEFALYAWEGDIVWMAADVLVLWAFDGPRDLQEYYPAHRDGDQENCCYANLVWAKRGSDPHTVVSEGFPEEILHGNAWGVPDIRDYV